MRVQWLILVVSVALSIPKIHADSPQEDPAPESEYLQAIAAFIAAALSKDEGTSAPPDSQDTTPDFDGVQEFAQAVLEGFLNSGILNSSNDDEPDPGPHDGVPGLESVDESAKDIFEGIENSSNAGESAASDPSDGTPGFESAQELAQAVIERFLNLSITGEPSGLPAYNMLQIAKTVELWLKYLALLNSINSGGLPPYGTAPRLELARQIAKAFESRFSNGRESVPGLSGGVPGFDITHQITETVSNSVFLNSSTRALAPAAEGGPLPLDEVRKIAKSVISRLSEILESEEDTSDANQIYHTNTVYLSQFFIIFYCFYFGNLR